MWYRTVSVRMVLALTVTLGCGFLLGMYLPPLVSGRGRQAAQYEEAAALPSAEAGPVKADSKPGAAAARDSGRTGGGLADDPSFETAPEAQKYNWPGFARSMPVDRKEEWLSWMRDRKRGDSAAFLEERWKLAKSFVGTAELKRPEDVRAFLLTPREHFVRARNKGQEYADTWLPIGYGATITDPDVVAMMTTTLAVNPGEKVLEIGTGSGYQSAILSWLTSEVYTIEIIKPLCIETDQLYRDLEPNFPSYANIKRKLGDGYYGWEEYAPFDKIIVTCAIDHIPPPLLKQLKAGGIMVLPLGPPGRQYIMEVKKEVAEDGTVTLSRRDVYNGLRVSFIPFRNQSGGSYSDSPKKP